MSSDVERLSRAVTLSVLELDVDRDVLVPAYLLANLMSPALWSWREERRVTSDRGGLLGVTRRLKELERQFHRYTFTHIPGQPGGDPWGLLDFDQEERRLGRDYIRKVRRDYHETLTALSTENPESQFGRIVQEDYYKSGYFPRLRNETIEVMDAYSTISGDGKGSGKCAGLAMLWAAALLVWARFPPENVVVVGNRAHVFVFLDEEDGHLFNNTKWFNKTRIQNASEISEFVKMVTTGTDTTFFYSPSAGMCQCSEKQSAIPRPRLASLYTKLRDFLAVPLKHPDPGSLSFVGASEAVLDPAALLSAEEYQRTVRDLARQTPGSIYDFAMYAFRRLDVACPEAYAVAALRDYRARQAAAAIRTLDDALAILGRIPGHRSVLGSRERIALPDETLTFQTGNDRDRALLLFALLWHSALDAPDIAVAISDNGSYVRFGTRWIDADVLSIHLTQPEGINLVFDAQGSYSP